MKGMQESIWQPFMEANNLAEEEAGGDLATIQG